MCRFYSLLLENSQYNLLECSLSAVRRIRYMCMNRGRTEKLYQELGEEEIDQDVRRRERYMQIVGAQTKQAQQGRRGRRSGRGAPVLTRDPWSKERRLT